MTDDRILKRSEVKKENTWATEDMFPSDQAWSEEYEALKEWGCIIREFER